MERFQVTNQAMADALRSTGVDHLAQFWPAPRSVSVAAEAAAIPLHRMYYWVKRFTTAGLLQVDAQQPRAGRPIKLYRAVADGFEIPPTLLPDGLLMTVWERETQAAGRAFEREVMLDLADTVLQVELHDERGVATASYVPRRLLDESARIDSNWWSSTRWYRREDAEQLITALRAAEAEFIARAQPPGTPGCSAYRTVMMVARDRDEAGD